MMAELLVGSRLLIMRMKIMLLEFFYRIESVNDSLLLSKFSLCNSSFIGIHNGTERLLVVASAVKDRII